MQSRTRRRRAGKVADRDGALVALTQSLGPSMGSKVAATGVGFVYAATMGYLGALPPGACPFSSQSPLIVLNDGQPAYVLGGAGGRRIISAIVEVVRRLVDEELSLADAMGAAPVPPDTHEDLHGGPTCGRMVGCGPSRAGELRVRRRDCDSATYFATIHGIEFVLATRDYIGLADPRWHGGACGPRR